jgi:hypothetical protein
MNPNRTVSTLLFRLSLLIVISMAGLTVYGLITGASDDVPPQEDVITSPDEPQPEPESFDSGGFFGGIWAIVMSIWGFFGRIGFIAQLLCCLLIPALVVIGMLNDSPIPR